MEPQVIIKFLIFLFVGVVVIGSHGALLSAPIKTYWNSELPNTPMPQSLKDSLPQSAVGVTIRGNLAGHEIKFGDLNTSDQRIAFFYHDAATEDELHGKNPIAALYFIKATTLQQGSIVNFQLTFKNNNITNGGRNDAVFLPRTEADKIPFSSKKMAQILNQLSIATGSKAAQVMKQTVELCEEPAIRGEEKLCATSLEAMVDFAKLKLGKNVDIITTEIEGENETITKQNYTIFGIKKTKNKNKAVVCHKMNYAYAVFNCHHIPNTEAYIVSLVGANGAKVKAAAACHVDTSAFNPKNLAFQVLKVKPGTVPVCHFLPEGHIVWVAN